MNQGNENDQKRLLLVVALSGILLLVWQSFFAPNPQVAPVTPADAGIEQTADEAPKAPQNPQIPAETSEQPIERRTIATLSTPKEIAFELTNDDGQIAAAILDEPQYRSKVLADGKESEIPFRFVDALTQETQEGLFLPPLINLKLAGRPVHGDYQLASSSDQQAELRWTDSQTGITVKRIFKKANIPYALDVTLSLENQGSNAIPFDLSIVNRGAENLTHSSGGFFSMFMPPIHRFEAICRRASDFERSGLQSIRSDLEDPDDPTRFNDAIAWSGVDNRYFMNAVIPQSGDADACEFFVGAEQAGLAHQTLPSGFDFVVSKLDMKPREVRPGQSETISFRLFMGPKKLDVLRQNDPPLKDAIDFGFFGIICIPMLWLLRLFYSVFTNWGVAIILLTIVVKLLTLPLTHKQYQSMAAMRVIQPRMKEIQEKYKNNQVKLQEEMMALYRDNKVNPMAGCLPMLIMMPIYFALYRSIYTAVELYQADFIFWIQDLSKQDPYYIFPLLLGVLMLAQMKINPSAPGGAQQKAMMYIMPVMMTLMMLFLPSGLVLYITVNTILGIIQQYWLLKKTQSTPAATASSSHAKAK